MHKHIPTKPDPDIFNMCDNIPTRLRATAALLDRSKSAANSVRRCILSDQCAPNAAERSLPLHVAFAMFQTRAITAAHLVSPESTTKRNNIAVLNTGQSKQLMLLRGLNALLHDQLPFLQRIEKRIRDHRPDASWRPCSTMAQRSLRHP